MPRARHLRIMRRRNGGAGPFVLAAALLGCSGSPDADRNAVAVLEEPVAGSTWELVMFEGSMVPAARPPAATLSFCRDGSVGGTAACNQGGSPLMWQERRFALPSGPNTAPFPVFTVMRCRDDQSSALGHRFWQRMMRARTWTRDGHRLTIGFADGSSAVLRLSAPSLTNAAAD